MSDKWWWWLLLIPVAFELWAWRGLFRRVVSRPAGRWATGLAGLAFVVSLTGGWLVDQAKAGIHPERLVAARIMVGVGFLAALMLVSAALLLAPKAPGRDPRGNPHPGA